MTTMPAPYLSLSFETIEARLWATDTVDHVFSDSSNIQPSSKIYSKPLPPAPINTDNAIFEPNSTYFYSGSPTILEMTAASINPHINTIDTTLTQSSLRQRRHTTSSTSSSTTTSYSSCSSTSFSNDQDNGYRSSTYSMGSPMFDNLSLSGHSDSGTDNHHQQQRQRSNTPQSFTSITSTSSAPPRTLSRRATLSKHLKRRFTLEESPTLSPSPSLSTSSVRRLFTSDQLLKERKALNMWRETLHGYLLDPAFEIPTPRHSNDSSRLAYCIISELLATEETYLGHLSTFKQTIIDPFLQAFQHRYMIRDLQTIFGHIPQLILLSSTLVRRWCVSLEQQTYYTNGKVMVKDSRHDIGKTFCDLEDEFKVYTYYAVHFAKAQKCITRMEQKPSYQQWMQAVLQKKENRRMGLSDYLIAPIQRITRYCLLVKDLMKHRDGHDLELERAFKYLKALALAMNNCQQI